MLLLPDHNLHSHSALSGSAGATLARHICLFDATMLVMGGIVGAGIFINPYVVARQVHTPALILLAWATGGLIALLGAFVYAELADHLPAVGGQYAYLRSAFDPMLGFLYGWALLLVIQTGGMAAVTVTFARYFRELTACPLSERTLAVLTLAVLTALNCLGVSVGSRVQSALMLVKIAALGLLIIGGLALVRMPHPLTRPLLDQPPSIGLLGAFGAAMVPVLFAFGGWQTTNFVAAEIKEPRRNLVRALLIGVGGVVLLYLLVNLACVRALGAGGLAQTSAPATAVMRLAMGERGAALVALGIAVSALGFLSQSVLTAPRVYFAMAEDGLFFRSVAYVSDRTRVPVVAIVLQSAWTSVIALSGRYEQILNYVVATDFLFFGLTATCLFVFRKRERTRPRSTLQDRGFRTPGHPFTTGAFVIACWVVVANTIHHYPANALAGTAILLLGIPVYLLWSRRGKKAAAA
jgi:APA family basic amino acid/polyamine antiporter